MQKKNITLYTLSLLFLCCMQNSFAEWQVDTVQKITGINPFGRTNLFLHGNEMQDGLMKIGISQGDLITVNQTQTGWDNSTNLLDFSDTMRIIAVDMDANGSSHLLYISKDVNDSSLKKLIYSNNENGNWQPDTIVENMNDIDL